MQHESDLYEHLVAIHGINGAQMTNEQIIQNLSCTIPADRYADPDETAIEYTGQQITLPAPPKAISSISAPLKAPSPMSIVA